MSRCPYCNHPTNPLRWLIVTSWAAYRCGYCGRRSRPPQTQLALAGAFGSLVFGILLWAIRGYGLVADVLLAIAVLAAVLVGMWLFCTLHPMEHTRDG